jgi:hypothetical protein
MFMVIRPLPSLEWLLQRAVKTRAERIAFGAAQRKWPAGIEFNSDLPQ